jgi:hypothetical protein
MFRKALPPGHLALFGLLSIVDLILTWRLLQDYDGSVYESNFVARWFLDGYGWRGLVALKAGSVLVVVGLAAWVSRWRPRTGRWVLTFACSAAALVVLYSSLLAWSLEAQPGEEKAVSAATKETRWLDSQLHTVVAYQELRSEVANALSAERCTFSEAISRLLQSEHGRSSGRLQTLRALYPGYSDEECLAINLLEHVLFSLADQPARAAQVAQRLEAEFRAYYGKPVPDRYGLLRVAESGQSLPQEHFHPRRFRTR